MVTSTYIMEVRLKFSGVNEGIHVEVIGCIELPQLLCWPFFGWVRFCFLGQNTSISYTEI